MQTVRHVVVEVKKQNRKRNSGSFGKRWPLCVSKRRLDKCPGPLRRVSLSTDLCSSGYFVRLLTMRRNDHVKPGGDNSINIQKHNIWSERVNLIRVKVEG